MERLLLLLKGLQEDLMEALHTTTFSKITRRHQFNRQMTKEYQLQVHRCRLEQIKK